MNETKLEVTRNFIFVGEENRIFTFCYCILQMFDDVGGFVEGEMSIPSAPKATKPGEPDFNTLDEPIRETIVCLLMLRLFYPVRKEAITNRRFLF